MCWTLSRKVTTRTLSLGRSGSSLQAGTAAGSGSRGTASRKQSRAASKQDSILTTLTAPGAWNRGVPGKQPQGRPLQAALGPEPICSEGPSQSSQQAMDWTETGEVGGAAAGQAAATPREARHSVQQYTLEHFNAYEPPAATARSEWPEPLMVAAAAVPEPSAMLEEQPSASQAPADVALQQAASSVVSRRRSGSRGLQPNTTQPALHRARAKGGLPAAKLGDLLHSAVS